jgi:hypothetical protein
LQMLPVVRRQATRRTVIRRTFPSSSRSQHANLHVPEMAAGVFKEKAARVCKRNFLTLMQTPVLEEIMLQSSVTYIDKYSIGIRGVAQNTSLQRAVQSFSDSEVQNHYTRNSFFCFSAV